jgi:hypothetical protein
VASVNVAVNGAADNAGGSGVTGGEYWIGSTVIAAGTGTSFSGLTASIPAGSLTAGPTPNTVQVRIRDAAGNWSAAVRTATVTVIPDAIFADGFELATLPGAWSSRSTNNATRLSSTVAAALSGARGLAAQGNNTNYVQYNWPPTTPVAGTYDARFHFNPNNNASTGNDVLSAATNSGFGTRAFRVRYRRSGAQPQVQIQLGATNTNLVWTNINNNAANSIEVVWQAVGSGGPGAGTLELHVNGVLAQTLTTASTSSIGAVRLGSVTSGGSNTLMFFDGFVSKRTVSPLVGP